MMSLDRAMTSFHMLSIAIMQFAILNAKLLSAAIDICANLPYYVCPSVDCSVRYSSVTIACVGL